MRRSIAEPSPELDALVHETIGAAIAVHRALGPGFLESIYEEALCVELTFRGISFARQVPLRMNYRSHPIGDLHMDMVVGGQLVVELKAVPHLLPIHVAQVISYLKAYQQPVGLLINFHMPLLREGIRRVVLSVGGRQSNDSETEAAGRRF